MATRVSLISLDDGSLAVSKVPLSGDRRDRTAEAHWLERASAALAAADPPPAPETAQRAGVVPLLDVVPTPGLPVSAATIVTARIPGETLRTSWLAPTGVAAALALVAELLAQLHGQGLAHGNLSADHVILDPAGPRLCSPHGAVTDPLTDSVGLGHCILSMLERWDRLEVKVANRPEWERLASLLVADPHPGADGDAATSAPMPIRRAARSLARLATADTTSGSVANNSMVGDASIPSSRLFRGLVAASAIGVLSLAGLAVINLANMGGSGDDPPTDLEVDGHLYQITAPPASATVIDNSCHDQPSVLVLDRERDLVWQFASDEIASAQIGQATAAAVLAEVPGAEQLAVEDGELCPSVWAIGPAGRTLVVKGS